MQKKLLMAFVVVLLLGISIISILFLGLIKSSHLNQMEENLISNGMLISEVLSEMKEALDDEEYNRIAVTYGKKINARITLIDENGVVIADTIADVETIENHRDRLEVQQAFKGDIGRALRYSDTLQEELYYVAIPVSIQPNNIRVIRLSVTLQQIQELNKKVYRYIGISVLLSLVVALIMAIRFIKKFMEPINEMTEISRKIATGDFRRRVDVTTNDEIGILADNFNYMADNMIDMIDKLSDSNTKFKALLTSIINPIIAVDNKHKIILINSAAEGLFNVSKEEALGRHILEVIRNNSLDEKFKEIFQNHNETQLEITINEPSEKTLKIYTNLIKLENDPTRTIGIVALLEDVTEIRKLEKMRSDFVANVSHELKTPLTSISGFVETLKSGVIEDDNTKLRFLDIIDIETERLTRLIDDILTLSEIENTHTKRGKEEIYPSQAINEVAEIMTPIAMNKAINLVIEVETNLPIILGSKDWFKQMLINLLDNAIKYTGDGGKVTINSYKKYNNLIIQMKDTGIGINKDQLPRLFERFYRVDKARSRKVGGTGLGLAIVKHIVLSFNGRIKVNSDIGKGTEFTVIIPIEKNKEK